MREVKIRKNFLVLAIFVISLIMNSSIHAQSMEDIFDKVMPQSPQATALTNAVEFPLNTFTGLPNINIPLYTITEGPVEVPISLSYQSSGLKVSEEASWVGLSWLLNAGGAITRIVKGKDDIYGHTNSELRGKLTPSQASTSNFETLRQLNFHACRSFNLVNGSSIDFSNFFRENAASIDSEPDLYIYNFNGYSGKFIIIDGQAIDLNNSDIKFELNNQIFTATTPDGVEYVFGEREYTKTVRYQYNETLPYTFYLSEIKDKYDPENSIKLSYISFKDLLDGNYGLFHDMEANKAQYVPQMPHLNELNTVLEVPYANRLLDEVANKNLGHSKTITNTYIDLKYLDTIEFRNGHIKFDKQPRSDTYGYSLYKMKVYSNEANAYTREYTFDYGYFDSEDIGNDSYVTSLTETSLSREAYYLDYRKKRLKLNHVTENGPNEKKYSFTYIPGTMPYKSSFAMDYWGYYNGKNNSTLIPDTRRYLYRANLPNEFDQWSGANREPSANHMKVGMLKTFTHPTKGTTTFEYEINQYENTADVQVGVVKQQPVPYTISDYNYPGEPSMPYVEFVVPPGDYDALADVNVSLYCRDQYCNSENRIVWPCTGGGGAENLLWAEIRKQTGPTSWQTLYHWDNSNPEIGVCAGNGDSQHSYTTYLSPGTYRAYVSYPDNAGPNDGPGDAGSANMNLRVYNRQEQSYSNEKTGGGLRLTGVTHDPLMGLKQTIEYSYEGGVMFKMPMFYWSEMKAGYTYFNGGWEQWEFNFLHYLHPTTIVPYSYSNGSLIGYQKITERISGNGKTVYNYYAEPSQLDFNLIEYADIGLDYHHYISGVEPTHDLKNGSLRSVEFYKEGEDDPIEKVSYGYSIVNPQVHWGFKFNNFLTRNLIDNGNIEYCEGLNTSFYPIRTAKVARVSHTTTKSNGNTAEYEATIRYEYDSKKHSQPTRTITEGSDGSFITTMVLFSKDYSNTTGPIYDLTDGNFLLPVEKVTFRRDGSSVSILGGKLNYYHGGILAGLPESTYSLELDKPLPLNNFRFSNMASSGVIPTNSQSLGSFNPDNAYSNKADSRMSYDSHGNIAEYEMKDGKYGAFLYNTNGTVPIASVKQARKSEISHTSFESIDSTGGWIYDISNSSEPCTTVCSDIAYQALEDGCDYSAFLACQDQPEGCYESTYRGCLSADTHSSYYQEAYNICMNTCDEQEDPIALGGVTGEKHFVGDNRSIVRTLSGSGDYVIACWAQRNGNRGTITVNGHKTFVNNPGWEYLEIPFTATTTNLTIDLNDVLIDELRLFPSSAQMTTYIYDPLIGITSQTDPNGITTYYEYDDFGRLIRIIDQEGYVLQSYEYHYKN